MQAGVTMVDPASTYIDVGVGLAEDVSLLPNTRLTGTTQIARGAEIGPDTQLVDCMVGEFAVVSRTDGRLATVGASAKVGPYVVLQPGSEVAPDAVVGPFFTAASDEEG
jgi:bifunctional UDP-N-acetylglucosamine pyrophosphorylase/glucosamine-1-phosphate N-acetyltransferase